MSDLEFMRSLDLLGTYEDMTNIINFITSRILITPDKLQSLLWLAYGWGLTILNYEIAPLQFVQTPYGPAEININKLYPAWDSAIIPQVPAPKLNPKVEHILTSTIKTYGSLSNEELDELISWHCKDVSPGEDISAREIFMFFSKTV